MPKEIVMVEYNQRGYKSIVFGITLYVDLIHANVFSYGEDKKNSNSRSGS